MNEEIYLKILILGDSNVGKTSLLFSYIDNYCPETHMATIGVEFKEKKLELNGHKINLQIWDTSGQERFRSLTRNYFRDADGILFVYDITTQDTFTNLKDWIKDAENNGKFEMIIIGNKCDLDYNREVSKDFVEKFCNKKNIKSLETSAKTDINVYLAFETLILQIIGSKSDEELLKQYKKNRSFSIGKDAYKAKKQKKKCC